MRSLQSIRRVFTAAIVVFFVPFVGSALLAAGPGIELDWSVPVSGTPNSNHALGAGDVDAAGTLHVGGSTRETIWFGDEAFTPASTWGLFVAELNPVDGTPAIRPIATSNEVAHCDVLVHDRSGGWFMGGSITGTTSFETGPVAPTGDADMFVARFDAQWGLEWIHLDESVSPSFDLRDLAIDAEGNSYVAGQAFESVQRLFLRKLDPAGDVVWQLDGNAASLSQIFGLAVTDLGEVLCTGWTEQALTVDTKTIPAGGFVAKLEGDGGLLWAASAGGAGATPHGVTVDGAGSVYLTGSFFTTAAFPDTTLEVPFFAYPNGFVAKYEADGAHAWARELPGTTFADEVVGIDVDISPEGEIVVSGQAEDVTFPDVEFAANVAFVASYDAEGNYSWAADAGDPDWHNPQVPQSVIRNDQHHVVTGLSIQKYSFSMPTAVSEEHHRQLLSHSYSSPNPCNPSTTIHFELRQATQIDLTIFDLRGVRVRRLLEGRRSTGQHDVPWNGRDDSGQSVGSGVYVYRLRAGSTVASGKVTLVK